MEFESKISRIFKIRSGIIRRFKSIFYFYEINIREKCKCLREWKIEENSEEIFK